MEIQLTRLLQTDQRHIQEAFQAMASDPSIKRLVSLEEHLQSWDSWRCFGGSLLYVITRLTSPEFVVETGVANGLSSAYILSALDRNGHGSLQSIDLGVTDRVAPGKGIGWVVRDALRPRWKLQLGDSREILPNLLDDVPAIDLFLHDSNHSYDHMMWEFRTVWGKLKEGGLLLSDDIWLNRALFDFAGSVGHAGLPLYFSNMGGIMKQPTSRRTDKRNV